MIEEVRELLKDKGELLYLTKYGSHLYGTNNENSDYDYKGIFLPFTDYFYSNENIKSINLSTGGNNCKNSKDDIDIELYTLQYFIHKLVKEGDTGGLDLLFSVTNKDAVLHGYLDMCMIKGNIHKILNIKTADAYIGYAIGQAKKYGVKGSRLGVLKQIKEYCDNNIDWKGDIRLSDFVKDILDKFGHESYCFNKHKKYKDKIEDYLCICGSMHQYNITIKEFCERINKAFNSYGDRTFKAFEDNNIDWKALSHSVRVLYQCIELFTSGKMSFPLPENIREKIINIKQGKISYGEVEQLILKLLEEVDKVKINCNLDWKYDKEHCIRLVKYFYKDNFILN